MKTKGLLILLIIQLYSFRSFACQCLQDEWSVERVNNDIRYSDLVFIGNRISYSRKDPTAEEYSFKVIEAFKGSIKEGDIIKGKALSGCSTSPYLEGLWIVYATEEEGSYIDMDGCGLSRSLNEPEVPLPPPDSFDKDLQEGKFMAFPAFLREWQNEYIILQSYKNLKLSAEEEGASSREDNTILIYISLGLAIVALGVSLLKE